MYKIKKGSKRRKSPCVKIVSEKEELYEAAIEQWGLSFELSMLCEECSELIQAAIKVSRLSSLRSDEPEELDNLIEEIADVQIM